MVKFTEREAGVYRCRFEGIDLNYVITDRESGQDVTRWRWQFTETKPKDPGIGPDIDTITSPSLGARTNGLKFFTGMLGRPPTKQNDTDDLIGQVFDVTYAPNQAGRLTITNVTRVGLDDQPKPAAPEQAELAGAELP